MTRKLIFIVVLIISISVLRAQQPGVVKATLNGLRFEFDAQNGSIVSLSHQATGVMLKSSPDSAGLIDIAFPVKEFEPLRLASRYSKNARITKGAGTVVIHWENLGASRSFTRLTGKVAATVTLKEEPDGRSVSMSCTIENKTDRPVPQVIFPDLSGFLPFNGQDGTEFRTGGTAMKPFVDLVVKENDNFYAMNESMRRFHYGFVLDAKNLVIKWMDLGGRKGGLSIFAKDWGVNGGYDESVYLKLYEKTRKLRFMHTKYTNIAPNTSWKSAEFILTPHASGWAQGIIPYRQWAQKNIKRLYPVPDHIRDGLGYRTIWMKISYYRNEPDDIYFRISDLPQVAKESKEHGLDELNLWNWYENLLSFTPRPFKYLGTEKDMKKAVEECRKIGVNVSPFLTVMKIGPEGAKRYGLEINTNYMYDLEFIPAMNPRYSVLGRAASVPNSHKLWRPEVLAGARYLIDSLGISSFCWDQFFSDGSGRYLDTLVTEVRKMQKQENPQATFSGEAGTNMEYECDYLDYTWNWDYRDNCDYRAVLSSLPGTRINLNIDRSVEETKTGFADNLYLNVMPRKPDGINGSDNIANYPKLSAALKQCARLRKQFLDYFVKGTFIADCILSKNCSDAHVSAYTLNKNMLVIVINKKDKKQITFEADIRPWLPSSTGRYKVKQYNDGALVNTTTLANPAWVQKTEMKNLDIYMYEVIAE